MLRFDSVRVLSFDCYGTLIDWETGILNALRPILIAHQVKLGQDDALELFAGLETAQEAGAYQPYRVVLQNVLSGMGERLGFTPGGAEVTAFGQSVAQWPPFPDSAAALAALKPRFRLVILSNIDDDLFASSAARLGVAFDDVITAEQCRSYKPALDNFRAASERIRVPPGQWVHVAQSLFHDIAPANRLGIPTVWVNRRHARSGSGATPPAAAAPDLQVDSLAELAELALAPSKRQT